MLFQQRNRNSTFEHFSKYITSVVPPGTVHITIYKTLSPSWYPQILAQNFFKLIVKEVLVKCTISRSYKLEKNETTLYSGIAVSKIFSTCM